MTHGTRVQMFLWGNAAVLDEGERYRVVRLKVFKDASVPEERHKERREVLVALEGRGEVELADGSGRVRTLELWPGETVVIPRGTWYSLCNTGKGMLVVLETWIGECREEDAEYPWQEPQAA